MHDHHPNGLRIWSQAWLACPDIRLAHIQAWARSGSSALSPALARALTNKNHRTAVLSLSTRIWRWSLSGGGQQVWRYEDLMTTARAPWLLTRRATQWREPTLGIVGGGHPSAPALHRVTAAIDAWCVAGGRIAAFWRPGIGQAAILRCLSQGWPVTVLSQQALHTETLKRSDRESAWLLDHEDIASLSPARGPVADTIVFDCVCQTFISDAPDGWAHLISKQLRRRGRCVRDLASLATHAQPQWFADAFDNPRQAVHFAKES